MHIGISLHGLLPFEFKNLYNTHFSVSKNKTVEIEVTRSNVLFEIELSAQTKTDHAGADLALGLLGHTVHLSFYDNRHWDYKNNQYEQA